MPPSMEGGGIKNKKKKQKSIGHRNRQLDVIFLNKDRLNKQYTGRSFKKPKSNGELR